MSTAVELTLPERVAALSPLHLADPTQVETLLHRITSALRVQIARIMLGCGLSQVRLSFFSREADGFPLLVVADLEGGIVTCLGLTLEAHTWIDGLGETMQRWIVEQDYVRDWHALGSCVMEIEVELPAQSVGTSFEH